MCTVSLLFENILDDDSFKNSIMDENASNFSPNAIRDEKSSNMYHGMFKDEYSSKTCHMTIRKGKWRRYFIQNAADEFSSPSRLLEGGENCNRLN